MNVLPDARQLASVSVSVSVSVVGWGAATESRTASIAAAQSGVNHPDRRLLPSPRRTRRSSRRGSRRSIGHCPSWLRLSTVRVAKRRNCSGPYSSATDTSVQMIRNVPHLALIPLVIVWFGIDEQRQRRPDAHHPGHRGGAHDHDAEGGGQGRHQTR